jgi:hypothetical protein
MRRGPKRTSRFVIIVSTAVFDRVKAKDMARRSDARKRQELPWEREEPMESHGDVPKH